MLTRKNEKGDGITEKEEKNLVKAAASKSQEKGEKFLCAVGGE